MTVAERQTDTWRPAPVRTGDGDFVELAARMGTQCGPRAAEHDRDNTFVAENYALLRDAGYIRLAVPKELGGLGATLRQVCYAQAELAKYCGATALAVNMHFYVTLVTAYRWRHGATETAGLLRSVADDGAILMTSGGSDGIWPSAVASRVEAGYRVSGRKVFCSQAPAATLITTSAVYEDPREGMTVLAIMVPMSGEGVRIIETWDTLGMRGTSSHDTQLTEVFVPDQAVITRREWGRWTSRCVTRSSTSHRPPPPSTLASQQGRAMRR